MYSRWVEPLRMIVSGTAGTGKSYLINCLKLLLQHHLCVSAPIGVASFNIEGITLHSLFSLPTTGNYKQLQDQKLTNTQQSLFADVSFNIIDEMSMVGRNKLTGISAKSFHIYHKKFWEVIHVYCLVTSVNCPQC